jgi:hypothetical protein
MLKRIAAGAAGIPLPPMKLLPREARPGIFAPPNNLTH